MAALLTHRGRASALPIHLIAQAVPMLTRHELAALTERLIEYLDALDPNPDIEPNGDELDGNNAEDDFWPNWQDHGHSPGCPISDPDTAIDDQACDEPYQDLEEEYRTVPVYITDQSAGAMPWHLLPQ